MTPRVGAFKIAARSHLSTKIFLKIGMVFPYSNYFIVRQSRTIPAQFASWVESRIQICCPWCRIPRHRRFWLKQNCRSTGSRCTSPCVVDSNSLAKPRANMTHTTQQHWGFVGYNIGVCNIREIQQPWLLQGIYLPLRPTAHAHFLETFSEVL